MAKRIFAMSALVLAVLLSSCNSKVDAPGGNPNINLDLPVYEGLSDTKNTLTALEAGGYTITVLPIGDMPPEALTAVNVAAQRWQSVIVDGLSDITGTLNAGECMMNPEFTGTIDDLLLFATATEIDGPGGALAQAGPCIIRTDNGLPAVGIVIIDAADITAFSGQLSEIVVHEMGHVMGIGTLWDNFNLLLGAGSSNSAFLGSRAFNEYIKLGGFSLPPLESEGGPGTKDRHWRESVFDNELMTGYLNAGAANPLSRMSIASLGDLGYNANLEAAESYQLPGGGGPIFPFGVAQAKLELKEHLVRPIARIK